MKAKFLVFFGIVAIGIAISIFTLTKCDRTDGEGSEISGPAVATTDQGGTSTSPGAGPGSPDSTTLPTNDSTGSKAAGNGTASVNSPGTAPNSTAPGTPEMVKTTPGVTPSDPGAPATYRSGASSPEGVVGVMANALSNNSFQEFLAAAGEAAIPPQIRERLKALIENPNLKLSPDRPFWEVAKTRDSVRWMLEFVPTKEGAGEPQSIVLDIAKVSPTDYKISSISLPPTLKEVVAAIENPQANPDVKIDSLNVAQAFSKAVMSEDFVSARKLCSPKVTDERIAGLMIALEEGKFAMREDRPLIVTFSRDTVSWVLSRVNSPEHSSEFALELEQGDAWMVAGLTFGKVIASLAREVDGPYSPIVEDPSGGESLVVYFDFDASGLSSRADNQLKIVANILKQDVNRRIRITGHADALGSDDYNRGLSSKRAESIRLGIIARGANPDQVITEGYGESRPRKPNFKEDGTDNPTGRSENRRAEVYLDF